MPIPFPHAHVVTTTTHKSLRGPRGGLILCQRRGAGQEAQLGDLPGPAGRPADACHRRQGGGVRRGAAAGLQDLREERRRKRQGAGGDAARQRLRHRLRRHRQPSDAGRPAAEGPEGQRVARRRWCAPPSPATRTAFPFDPEKPFVTSGIRLGTPAATTRGFGVAEFKQVGEHDRRSAGRGGAERRTARRRWSKPPSRKRRERSRT